MYTELKGASPFAHTVAAKIAQYGNPGESKKILDVGCGDGRDVMALTRLGHQVVGISNEGDVMRKAHRMRLLGSSFMEVDITQLRNMFLPGQFDVVMANDSLHMLASRARLKQAMSDIMVITAEGGLNIVSGYVLDPRASISARNRSMMFGPGQLVGYYDANPNWCVAECSEDLPIFDRSNGGERLQSHATVVAVKTPRAN